MESVIPTDADIRRMLKKGELRNASTDYIGHLIEVVQDPELKTKLETEWSWSYHREEYSYCPDEGCFED